MKFPPILQVLVAAALAWVLVTYFPIASFGGIIASYAIWLCVILGAFLLAFALNVFRKHETTFDPLDPSKAQKLVVTGAYRFTRNPMYLGMAILLVAWCLFLGDLISFVVLPLFVIVMNELQIKGEEAALAQKFGGDYVAYKRRVRRWI